MADTEKVTVNMNVVDLGQIDLLVEQGFYSNRTDFIKTSIRNQLSTHSSIIQETVTRKTFVMGVVSYSKKDLEKELMHNRKLDIKVIGMLIFGDDVTTDLLDKTINSLKVLGTLKATTEVKEYLSQQLIS